MFAKSDPFPNNSDAEGTQIESNFDALWWWKLISEVTHFPKYIERIIRSKAPLLIKDWLSRQHSWGFLPRCMIAHTPPLVSRATTGITPRKNMNVLDPFCLRREQLRGSNSNAGKMDQTWSSMALHDLYFRYVTLIKFICFLFRWYFWQIVVRMVSCQMKFTTLLGVVLMLTLLIGLMGALLTNWLNDNAGNAVAVSDINIRKVLCIELSVALSFMIIIILSSKWKRKPA